MHKSTQLEVHAVGMETPEHVKSEVSNLVLELWKELENYNLSNGVNIHIHIEGVSKQDA